METPKGRGGLSRSHWQGQNQEPSTLQREKTLDVMFGSYILVQEPLIQHPGQVGIHIPLSYFLWGGKLQLLRQPVSFKKYFFFQKTKMHLKYAPRWARSFVNLPLLETHSAFYYFPLVFASVYFISRLYRQHLGRSGIHIIRANSWFD